MSPQKSTDEIDEVDEQAQADERSVSRAKAVHRNTLTGPAKQKERRRRARVKAQSGTRRKRGPVRA